MHNSIDSHFQHKRNGLTVSCYICQDELSSLVARYESVFGNQIVYLGCQN